MELDVTNEELLEMYNSIEEDIKKALKSEYGVNAEIKFKTYHKLRKLVNKQYSWDL